MLYNVECCRILKTACDRKLNNGEPKKKQLTVFGRCVPNGYEAETISDSKKKKNEKSKKAIL